ncbi:hypothetical protein GCM10010270_85820 [Streptomyces violaceus]|uniref:hypothetical protein n=1 Tax=Streptomyces violaceus TaxID=1936 RepID=UPI0019CE4210|nr:hypothetical protein [Streptomyces janthinus]GGT00814.1 hypothetical protein GCM10010270_85820 [Streptomyces janthinus]
MAGNPIDKGRLMWIGKATVPLTFVHTSELAAYLAAAVDAEADNGERIDIGWDRPVSMREVADLMGHRPAARSSSSAPPPRPRTPSAGTPTSWAQRSTGDRPASHPSPPGGLTRTPRAYPSWSNHSTPVPAEPNGCRGACSGLPRPE